MLKVLKNSFIIGFFILAICAGFLFNLKHKVQNISKNLKTIKSQIVSEKENIHVLNAELTYLTAPNRIKKLVSNHLTLTPIDKSQVVDNLKLNKKLHEYELRKALENSSKQVEP